MSVDVYVCGGCFTYLCGVVQPMAEICIDLHSDIEKETRIEILLVVKKAEALST